MQARFEMTDPALQQEKWPHDHGRGGKIPTRRLRRSVDADWTTDAKSLPEIPEHLVIGRAPVRTKIPQRSHSLGESQGQSHPRTDLVYANRGAAYDQHQSGQGHHDSHVLPAPERQSPGVHGQIRPPVEHPKQPRTYPTNVQQSRVQHQVHPCGVQYARYGGPGSEKQTGSSQRTVLLSPDNQRHNRYYAAASQPSHGAVHYHHSVERTHENHDHVASQRQDHVPPVQGMMPSTSERHSKIPHASVFLSNQHSSRQQHIHPNQQHSHVNPTHPGSHPRSPPSRQYPGAQERTSPFAHRTHSSFSPRNSHSLEAMQMRLQYANDLVGMQTEQGVMEPNVVMPQSRTPGDIGLRSRIPVSTRPAEYSHIPEKCGFVSKRPQQMMPTATTQPNSENADRLQSEILMRTNDDLVDMKIERDRLIHDLSEMLVDQSQADFLLESSEGLLGSDISDSDGEDSWATDNSQSSQEATMDMATQCSLHDEDESYTDVSDLDPTESTLLDDFTFDEETLTFIKTSSAPTNSYPPASLADETVTIKREGDEPEGNPGKYQRVSSSDSSHRDASVQSTGNPVCEVDLSQDVEETEEEQLKEGKESSTRATPTNDKDEEKPVVEMKQTSVLETDDETSTEHRADHLSFLAEVMNERYTADACNHDTYLTGSRNADEFTEDRRYVGEKVGKVMTKVGDGSLNISNIASRSELHVKYSNTNGPCLPQTAEDSLNNSVISNDPEESGSVHEQLKEKTSLDGMTDKFHNSGEIDTRINTFGDKDSPQIEDAEVDLSNKRGDISIEEPLFTSRSCATEMATGHAVELTSNTATLPVIDGEEKKSETQSEVPHSPFDDCNMVLEAEFPGEAKEGLTDVSECSYDTSTEYFTAFESQIVLDQTNGMNKPTDSHGDRRLGVNDTTVVSSGTTPTSLSEASYSSIYGSNDAFLNECLFGEAHENSSPQSANQNKINSVESHSNNKLQIISHEEVISNELESDGNGIHPSQHAVTKDPDVRSEERHTNVISRIPAPTGKLPKIRNTADKHHSTSDGHCQGQLPLKQFQVKGEFHVDNRTYTEANYGVSVNHKSSDCSEESESRAAPKESEFDRKSTTGSTGKKSFIPTRKSNLPVSKTCFVKSRAQTKSVDEGNFSGQHGSLHSKVSRNTSLHSLKACNENSVAKNHAETEFKSRIPLSKFGPTGHRNLCKTQSLPESNRKNLTAADESKTVGSDVKNQSVTCHIASTSRHDNDVDEKISRRIVCEDQIVAEARSEAKEVMHRKAIPVLKSRDSSKIPCPRILNSQGEVPREFKPRTAHSKKQHVDQPKVPLTDSAKSNGATSEKIVEPLRMPSKKSSEIEGNQNERTIGTQDRGANEFEKHKDEAEVRGNTLDSSENICQPAANKAANTINQTDRKHGEKTQSIPINLRNSTGIYVHSTNEHGLSENGFLVGDNIDRRIPEDLVPPSSPSSTKENNVHQSRTETSVPKSHVPVLTSKTHSHHTRKATTDEAKISLEHNLVARANNDQLANTDMNGNMGAFDSSDMKETPETEIVGDETSVDKEKEHESQIPAILSKDPKESKPFQVDASIEGDFDYDENITRTLQDLEKVLSDDQSDSDTEFVALEAELHITESDEESDSITAHDKNLHRPPKQSKPVSLGDHGKLRSRIPVPKSKHNKMRMYTSDSETYFSEGESERNYVPRMFPPLRDDSHLHTSTPNETKLSQSKVPDMSPIHTGYDANRESHTSVSPYHKRRQRSHSFGEVRPRGNLWAYSNTPEFATTEVHKSQTLKTNRSRKTTPVGTPKGGSLRRTGKVTASPTFKPRECAIVPLPEWNKLRDIISSAEHSPASTPCPSSPRGYGSMSRRSSGEFSGMSTPTTGSPLPSPKRTKRPKKSRWRVDGRVPNELKDKYSPRSNKDDNLDRYPTEEEILRRHQLRGSPTLVHSNSNLSSLPSDQPHKRETAKPEREPAAEDVAPLPKIPREIEVVVKDSNTQQPAVFPTHERGISKMESDMITEFTRPEVRNASKRKSWHKRLSLRKKKSTAEKPNKETSDNNGEKGKKKRRWWWLKWFGFRK